MTRILQTAVPQPPNTETGISTAQIRREMNRWQIRLLPIFSGSICLLFVFYGLLQQLLLREQSAALLVTVALLSAALLLGLVYVTVQITLPEEWADPLFGTVMLLVLLSMMLRLYLTQEPKQAANLILYVAATGVLFTSPRWLGAMLLLPLLGWLSGVWLLLPLRTDATFYAVVITATAATAVLLYTLRVRTLQENIELRVREQRQRRELERLTIQMRTNAAVGRQITSILEPTRLLPRVTHEIRRQYDLSYAGLYLREKPTGEQMLIAAESGSQPRPPGSKQPISSRGLAGQVLQNGRSLRIDDLLQAQGYDPRETVIGARSELIVPIRIGQDVLGVLDLQSRRRYAFTQEDTETFQLLADQVAIAIENSRLYAATEQFNRTLEQKVAERTTALNEAYDRLERLDRTKADFITIASHEMRTPLTIMSFYSQMFLEDEQLRARDDAQKWARGIHQGAMRMEEVVERMLDVAKIDSASLTLHPGPLNVPFLLQTVRKRFAPDLEQRRLTFTVQAAADLPEIEADAEAMQKVFFHLFVNAIKYTPDGGAITVSAQRRPEFSLPQGTAACVEIIVADSGIGIAPDAQELIFEKFYQTGEVMLHSSGRTSFKGGGPGLGLAIARGIVRAHHGMIWAESAGLDETTCPGSQFHVVLPIEN